MKYTARDESRVANIAQAKPSAIFVTRLSSRAIYFLFKQNGSLLSVLLYFTLTSVSKYNYLISLTHLLNIKIVFFDNSVSII